MHEGEAGLDHHQDEEDPDHSAKGGQQKQTLGKLKAGQKAGLCVEGPKGAKGDFFIKGSKSKLVVTLS